MLLLSVLRWLEKPVFEINVTKANPNLTDIKYMGALSGGEAVVTVGDQKVVRINKQGQTVKELYDCEDSVTCSNITSLLIVGSNLCVIHSNINVGASVTAQISVICIQTGKVMKVYQIPDAGTAGNYGSLFWDTSVTDPDLLFLTDLIKGDVFSFRFSTQQKHILVKEQISHLTSVSYGFDINNKALYIVCFNYKRIVNVYNFDWEYVRSIGNGELMSPMAAIVSPMDTIIISDFLKGSVFEYTIEGELVCTLVYIKNPYALSFNYPYLWVLNYEGVYRYLMYG